MKTSESIMFDAWLKLIKQKRKLTMREIAEKIGVSRQTIYNWKSNPKKLKALEIAGFLYVFNLDDDLKTLCESFGIDRNS